MLNGMKDTDEIRTESRTRHGGGVVATTRGAAAAIVAATAIAVSVGITSGSAHAGVTVPDSFEINAFTSGGGFTENLTIASYEFGTLDFLDATDDGAPDPLHIAVDSGLSGLAGYDVAVVFDYTAYDLTDFGEDGFHRLSLNDVFGGAAWITEVVAFDASGVAIDSIVTNGGGIVLETTTGRIVDGDGIVSIHFATIPAPGVLACAGVAFASVGRRRR